MDWQNVILYKNFKPNRTTFCRRKKALHYASDFICLDTETSWNHDETNKMKNAVGWIYQWCFSYQDKYIIGRTVPQLLECFDKIIDLYTNDKQTTIIFIHNLSYDLQYLKDFLIDKYGTDYKMLAIKEHKFISFSIKGLEFRCSYQLSNKSLKQWSKDLKIKHPKITLKEGYDLIRYDNSPLTKNDWKYQIRDVMAMKECIEKEMELEGDKHISSLPLTSTGFVRRDGRRKFKENYVNNHNEFLNTRLNPETYVICKNAFMGGLTHANRFLVDKTVTGNIKHFDFTSHYPSQQRCSREFPTTKFELISENLSFDMLDEIENKMDMCYICVVTFKDIELKDKKEALPYISQSKALEGKLEKLDIYADNGRIKKCNGCFTLSLTNLDLRIIRKQYKFKKYIVNIAYGSQKGYLPLWFCEFVDKFFYGKSYYKELSKQQEEFEINLMKEKNKLNGIYGMSATDPIRTTYLMNEFGEWTREVPTAEGLENMLNKFYKNKNSFLPFQWGVFTTANARYELMRFYYAICEDVNEEGQKYYNYNNWLYADTDSHFFIATEHNIKAINNLNKQFREQAEQRHEYIETENKRYYYHSFEDEEEDIVEFRALHSKCYAYNLLDEEGKKKLKSTIAGVTKRKNNVSRETELVNIDRLTKGTEFFINGGTRCVYIERNELTNSCAIILPTTKKLNNIIDAVDEFYLEEGEIE